MNRDTEEEKEDSRDTQNKNVRERSKKSICKYLIKKDDNRGALLCSGGI